MILGEWDEARRIALETAHIFQGLRDSLTLNLAYTRLGDIALKIGDLPEARQYFQQSIQSWQELGQVAFIAHQLESFAFIARVEKKPWRAVRLLGAAEAVQEGLGTSAFGVERLEDEYQKTISWLHTQMDENAYLASWSEGKAMTLDQAVSYALD